MPIMEIGTFSMVEDYLKRGKRIKYIPKPKQRESNFIPCHPKTMVLLLNLNLSRDKKQL